MALTLVTNPVGSAAKKLFAGFLPINFEFKREDLQIDDIEAGTGGIKINVSTDLTSYLSEGDTIYVYSEGADYTYDATGTILAITATEITIDVDYVQSATGGYINYLKNYYVELQCVNKDFTGVNILPFSLESDGTPAGVINIDVSIVNDKNRQRGDIVQKFINESSSEYLVKYRQVYEGSAEAFTVVSNKLVVALYCTEQPEEQVILNRFDEPMIFLGYPAAVVMANSAGPTGFETEMIYNELDINKQQIASGSLGNNDRDVNGFLLWKWLSNASVDNACEYVEFETNSIGLFDFASPDFASPDFITE